MTPNFWTWATDHWWLAFWLMFWAIMLAWSLGAGALNLLSAVLFKPPNRALRSRNIRAQGWPPAHLDADGDFRPSPKQPA